MNPIEVVIALAVGVALGGFYFGGLWLTVRKLASARQPALLLLGSFVLRTGGVLVGFYLVMDGRWERIAAALIGFVVARVMLIRILGDHPVASKASQQP